MPTPQPRSETYSKADLSGYSRPDEETFPVFPTSGDLKVTLTNDSDVPMTLSLRVGSFGNGPKPLSSTPPEKTASADGGTATIETPAPRTYYQAVVEWETPPSSGGVDLMYEQTVAPERGVDVDEALL